MKKKHYLKFTFMALVIFIMLLSISVISEATDEVPDNSGVTEETVNNSLHIESEDREENAFSLFFSYVTDYSGEIMCALAFASSAVIAFLYKKGLLPTVKNGLSVIGNAVGSMKSTVEKGESEAKAQSTRLIEMLDVTKDTVDGIREGLDTLADKLASIEGEKAEQKRLRTILEGQTELLYDVFMSSSLPQYKKDEIGERVKKMREIIASGDTE